MGKKVTKVPVSTRAVVARINRKLAEVDEVLRRSRPHYVEGRPFYDQNVGEFYRVDTRRNFLVQGHVDLEALGRELEVLKGYEALEGRV